MSTSQAYPAYRSTVHPYRCEHCGEMVPAVGLLVMSWGGYQQRCRACMATLGFDVSGSEWDEIVDMARAPHEVAL